MRSTCRRATWFERAQGRHARRADAAGAGGTRARSSSSSARRSPRAATCCPPDIADELAKLQDRVPPFPGAAATRHRSSRPTASRWPKCSQSFDADAARRRLDRAGARRARCATGEDVVVKVLRPGMRARDRARPRGACTRWPASRATTSSEGRRLRPVEVVREYEKTILDELDLMREAANAAQLKRNFAGSDLLYVPEVYWDYCRPEVMVMERIHGIPVSDMDELRRRGTNIQRAGRERRGDLLHPGVPPQLLPRRHAPGQHLRAGRRPERPRYAAVDFGIVGTLDARDQHYLAENFLAFFDRDYRRVAQLHVESGWVPAGHARRRVRGRHPHRLRADLQQAADGDLLRRRC